MSFFTLEQWLALLVSNLATLGTVCQGNDSRLSDSRTTVTASSTYTQSEITALMQDVQYLMQGLKALIDDLHATAGHGLIGP